jgi:hypothetical protein
MLAIALKALANRSYQQAPAEKEILGIQSKSAILSQQPGSYINLQTSVCYGSFSAFRKGINQGKLRTFTGFGHLYPTRFAVFVPVKLLLFSQQLSGYGHDIYFHD